MARHCSKKLHYIFHFRDPPEDSDEEDEVAQALELPADQPRRQNQSRRRRSSARTSQEVCRKCKVGRRWSRRVDNCKYK